MKKQIIALALCFAFSIPATASTVKPLTLSNHSDKGMLVGMVSEVKMDLHGSVFGIVPIGAGQAWASMVTINNPTSIGIAVVEDDGFDLAALFNDNSDIKVVCAMVADQRDDSNGVFNNAIITPGNSTHHCSVSNDGKSLDIN
jgi:hypothetical protein